jgi:hypothetical protein
LGEQRGALTKASCGRWLLATRCVIVPELRADQTGSSLLHTSPNEAALSRHSQFVNTVTTEPSRIAFRNLQANSCLSSLIAPLRHSTPSSPRGPNGFYQTCSYHTTSDRGKFRQQICDTRTALRVLWDLDWGIEVLQETVFRSCAQQ